MTDDEIRDRIADAIPRHYADPEAAELADALLPVVNEVVAAKIERVEALVGDFVQLSRALHSVVQAEAYADAAADLRRALKGFQ